MWEYGESNPSGFELAELEAGKRLLKRKNTPDDIKKLIDQCWDANPSKRPSFEQILENLKNID